MPPAHMLALVERLPEGSMTVSMRHDKKDWREYLGADMNYYVQAGIYNAVNDNTLATGNWGKKKPKIKPWPVPQVAKKLRDSKPRSVKDLFARVQKYKDT